MKLVIHNLTKAQALTFIAWYDGQGEQDADCWFDEAGVPVPYADNQRKGGSTVVTETEVNFYTKTHV